MKTLVSIVVPFYNEEENVPLLSAKIDEVFAGSAEYDYECLFVNDGSTDGTRAELEKLAKTNSRVRALHLVQNRGQSAALVAGMRRARGEYVFILDGDLQNDPCDFPKMLELLQDYDCVCGYRANRQDSWVRLMSSRIANKTRALFVPTGTRDAGCGSKGFRRACVPYIVSFNGAHRFLDSVIVNAGFSVTECPVTHHPRQHGVSKYGIHNRLWRGMYDLIGVRWLCKRYVTFEVEGEDTHG